MKATDEIDEPKTMARVGVNEVTEPTGKPRLSHLL